MTCAGDGATAIAALANADFDAIILDLIMPDVDGFTVLERLRATKPHLLHRVIVTTAFPRNMQSISSRPESAASFENRSRYVISKAIWPAAHR